MVRKVGLTDSVGFACLEDLQLSNSYMWGTAISLDYCGREDCIKGWKFGPYVRESYVIHMVKKGKGTFTIAGKTYELGPGQAFIIRPGEETTYRADDDDPWSYMWVGFHGYRAEDFIEAMGYVKAAVDFITEKYMNKIKIDDIADFIGISRSHLTGSFKKEMGVSPQEYLINFRLEKAASLLRSSKEQINIIAYQCGYEDSLSFSKAFKQKFGMSPKSFRNLEVELETKDAKFGHEASKL